MPVGDFDSPSVTYWAKDLGPVLIARWLVPANPAHFVVELGREPLDSRHRRATVDEHELQSFVSTGSSEVVEYLFDGTRLGR